MQNQDECALDGVIKQATMQRITERFPFPSLRVQNAVLRFFVEHARSVPELSVSGLLSILDLAQAYPVDWQDRAREQFRRRPRRMELPPFPVIRPAASLLRGPRDQIIHGSFEDCATSLLDHSVDLVVTSPPYAMQRHKIYGGIIERDYPEWTSRWMAAVRRVLKPNGSVIIIIRPHVRDGKMASYVRRTLDQLEKDDWNYCDDLAWYKPDAPPLGDSKRPRRAWEPMYWLSLASHPYCNPKACGQLSSRLGFVGVKGMGKYVRGASDQCSQGVARAMDVIVASVAGVDRASINSHPAQFPVSVPEYLIRMLSPKGGLILDPFIGSGTTAVAALGTGRHFMGFETNGGYVNIARKRIKLFRERGAC